ncbi:MAG: ATPase domain-containing protein [Candidatus Bathyarchaeia archaeon]
MIVLFETEASGGICLDLVKSGIRGFDELVSGGLPKGKCILLVGGPGSGKTIFALQFLKTGAESSEPSLYITLDEKPEQVKEDMKGFGWEIDKLEKEGALLLLDATPLRRSRKAPVSAYRRFEGENLPFPKSELSLHSLIKIISKIVEEEDIQRIAIDPITALVVRYEDAIQRRRASLAFFDSLVETGCTVIITSELRTSMLDRRFQLEEYLSQGVILLHSIVHNGDVIKAIQIEKMRGVKHDTQLRPYRITDDGFEVFPKDRIF